MMKRTLSILTAAVLATALSAPAFAAGKKHSTHHRAAASTTQKAKKSSKATKATKANKKTSEKK